MKKCHWVTSPRHEYDVREARGLARRYVRSKLGVDPSLVRAYPNGDVRVYVRPGVRLWGFFTREPVAFDDYYIDVHICWSLPCPGCGRALA